MNTEEVQKAMDYLINFKTDDPEYYSNVVVLGSYIMNLAKDLEDIRNNISKISDMIDEVQNEK